jgi:glycosyltransferase involved in cell wall biosynthesis
MQPFVSEVIVCDCGSSDRSVAIAREYGAKVIKHGDFADEQAIRLQCARRASSPWILWLNPQDRVAEEDAQQIEPLLQSAEQNFVEITLPVPHSKLCDEGGRFRKQLRFRRKEAPNGATATT